MKRSMMRWMGVAAVTLALGGGTSALAQPANFSPSLQEVVKLTQAHMSDDVVVAYIHNSGASYTLTADDILYLNQQGVSQPVLSELLRTRQYPTGAPAPVVTPAPAPPPAPVTQPTTPAPAVAMAPEPPPGADAEVNLAYFQNALSPAGAWVDVPGYGQCWRPTVMAQNPDWRPYCDAGHWVFTDDGWSWQSDYPWGDVAFHYGRWYRDWRWGWVWTPGYHWGPAWVSWRHAEGAGYCGWAPLPPEARFEVGVGITFGGHVGLDIDFGLAPAAYVFVPFDHFWEPSYRAFVAPVWRSESIFRASVVINDYHFEGGHFVVGGLGRERIALLTHHAVPMERVVIHDERVARAREIQHVHSAEVRHEVRHEDAVRQEQEIHHDVRKVEEVHHTEAVQRAETVRRPEAGRAVGPSHGAEAGRKPGEADPHRDQGSPR